MTLWRNRLSQAGKQLTGSTQAAANLGAIVLCGGRSTRMGFDKCRLPFGDSTLLHRIVGALATRVSRIVLSVRSPEQKIDLSHQQVIVIPDKNLDCGPLEGLRAGLEYLSGECELAFVTACDAPLFDGAVVDFLVRQIGPCEVAVPIQENRIFGLTAIYRTNVHAKLAAMIAAGKRRVRDLPEFLDTKYVPAELLQQVDPQLMCLRNLNQPQSYFQLLREFQLPCDPEFGAGSE